MSMSSVTLSKPSTPLTRHQLTKNLRRPHWANLTGDDRTAGSDGTLLFREGGRACPSNSADHRPSMAATRRRYKLTTGELRFLQRLAGDATSVYVYS